MKKLASLLLSLCILSSALPVQAASASPPAWAADAYQALTARQIIGGEYGEVQSKTSGSITRQEFVDVLVQLLQGAVPSAALRAYSMEAPGNDHFADMADANYDHRLLLAAGYGILEGSIGSDGLRYASPKNTLTRQECAKFVVSLLDFFSDKLGYALEPDRTPAAYVDAAAIASWALPYTQEVAAYGLMKGDDKGSFNPLGELDWPSAVVLCQRILALMDAAVSPVSFQVL